MLDVFFANLQKIVLFTIVIVYILTAVGLYELLSLVFCYAVLSLVSIKRRNLAGLLRERLTVITQAFYDMLEGRIGVREFAASLSIGGRWFTNFDKQRVGLPDWITIAGSLAVFATAAYLRFYDPVTHPAPAMSDAYVTLVWMKYIEARILFHDGLYPQGFHIILSVIRKVSAIDPLLVLKFVGPLAAVLIVVGVYYFVVRTTRSAVAGMVAAFVLGVLGQWLPLSYSRQASTNSQEFGLMFVLPTTWFVFNYLSKGDRHDYDAAVSGIAVVGLVHPMAALFLAACIAASYVAVLLGKQFDFIRFLRMTAGGVIAVVIAVLPLAIGYLTGRTFHGSSITFATAASDVLPPPVTPFILAALGCASLGFLWLLFQNAENRAYGWLVLTVALVALLIYQAPRFGVKSLALAARSGEFLSLAIASAVGSGTLVLGPRISWSNRAKTMFVSAAVVALAVTGVLMRPSPANPYKLQSDASVEQYLRISTTMPPSDWLMVSNEEGYALAYGVGWHMHIKDLLRDYDPTQPELVLVAERGARKIKMPYIFIFQEKTIFRPVAYPPELEPILAAREREKVNLAIWIDQYRRYHNNIRVYYEDSDLVIWVIEQPRTPKERFEEIWGPSQS